MAAPSNTKRSTWRVVGSIILWPLRYWRWIAAALILLAVAHIAYRQYLLRQLAHQRAEIQAEGGVVSPKGLEIEGLGPLNNAAVPYQHAAMVFSESQLEHFEPSKNVLGRFQHGRQPACMSERNVHREQAPSSLTEPLTPAELEKVADYMAATERAIEFIREAQQMEHCRFGMYGGHHEIVASPQILLPRLAEWRVLGRNIRYRALWALDNKDYEHALNLAIMGLRLANQVTEEPLLIAGLVRNAAAGLGLETLHAVLDQLPPEYDLPSALHEELARLDDPEYMAHALEGERVFNAVNSKEMRSRMLFEPFGLTIRMELTLNRLYGKAIAVLRTESFEERQEILSAIQEDANSESGVSAFWNPANSMIEAVLGALDAHFRVEARADLARLAIMLRKHKRAQGTYPEQLAELEAYGTDGEWLDPFSGERYHYKREGGGYAVWSVGMDREDDGGVGPPTPSDNDVVWCASG